MLPPPGNKGLNTQTMPQPLPFNLQKFITHNHFVIFQSRLYNLCSNTASLKEGRTKLYICHSYSCQFSYQLFARGSERIRQTHLIVLTDENCEQLIWSAKRQANASDVSKLEVSFVALKALTVAHSTDETAVVGISMGLKYDRLW